MVDRFTSARFGDGRPIHAGLMQRYVRDSVFGLMAESRACFEIAWINGQPTSNQTSFNGASLIWKPQERLLRTEFFQIRGFRLSFRAAITGGAGKARLRFFGAPTFSRIPEDAPSEEFATVTSDDIEGAADDYGPYALPLGEISTADDYGDDAYHVVLGAQAETDDAGTTVTIYRIWGEEVANP